jgi:hypothetical protein
VINILHILHTKFITHVVVRMFQQKFFTLINFPYKDAIESWKSENKWYDDSLIMILAIVVSFQTRPNFFKVS